LAVGRENQLREEEMAHKYVLKLTAEERAELEGIAKGTRGRQAIAAWKVQRARALLKCDQGEHGPGSPDHRVAAAVEATERSIQNWRKQAVLEGPLSVLQRKERSRPPTPRKLDGEGEAKLVQLACSAPPEGHSRWTLRLLAARLVELEVVDSISYETVRRTLKKTN